MPIGMAVGGKPASPGFKPVPVSTADTVVVPEGYETYVLYAWGDPISTGPAFKQDASNTAAEQEQQAGMHHDAIHYFPMVTGAPGASVLSSEHGLLVVNHEYTDDGLLHPDGMKTWTAAKVQKSQAAPGVSVIEVRMIGERWTVVRPSTYARRITAATPIIASGPAARDAALRTKDDASGRVILGTINNCAYGHTPWGTYLTCEENFNGYFVNASGSIPRSSGATASPTRGSATAGTNSTSASTRRSIRTSRTASAGSSRSILGIRRRRRSSAPRSAASSTRARAVALAKDNRVVVYMGDDERFEYIYKFVSSGRYQPGNRAANRDLLDDGTLYVAQFGADGSGEWLPLVFGQGALTASQRLREPGRRADPRRAARRTPSARRRWTGRSGSRSRRSTRTCSAR